MGEKERALLVTIDNGGSRAAPAHELGIARTKGVGEGEYRVMKLIKYDK